MTKHSLPLLSRQCAGAQCLTCPRPWRYLVTGMELSGRPGDNATWRHDATYDYRGRPYEKLTRARWRRVARRHAVIWGVGSSLAVWNAAGPWWALAAPGAVILTAATVAAFRVRTWLADRALRREFVFPAAEMLSNLTGVRIYRRHAHRYIQLPHGFGAAPEDGAAPVAVRVTMPAVIPLPDRKKEQVVSQVGRRLGMPNAEGVWVEAGSTCYVEIAQTATPPKEVRFAAVRAAMEALPLETPLIGVAAGGKHILLDFDNDSPHTLASAGSGAGKSTTFRFIAMQRMRHGAGAIFLDFKLWSHMRWVRGLPAHRALYFHEIEKIHEALVAVMEEIIRRKSITDERVLDEQRTIDVYVEELNTLMPMLMDYWKEYVARRKAEARALMRRAKAEENEDGILLAEEKMAEAMSLPALSPARQALKYGVNLGREFHVHFHFMGQSVSAPAAGGRDTRASFRTRLLAQWDRADWKMLAPGIRFIVCPPAARGIWAHVHGSEVEIVRVPFTTNEEAHEYVLGGREDRREILPARVGGAPPSLAGSGPAAIEEALPLSAILPGLPPRRDGTAMTLKALRLAAARPGFPAGVPQGPGRPTLFPAAAVYEWFAAREGLPELGQ